MADLTFTFDLEAVNGDFATVSDLKQEDQHQEHILIANKGDYFLDPLIGLGIESRINSPLNAVELEKDIRTELERDGYRVNVVNVSSDFTVDIDAQRLIKP